MALPKLTYVTKKIKVPSANKELEFEPFTTMDEKKIVLMDESSTAYDKARIQLEILEKCCKTEGFNFHTLSVSEISYLFLQLRKISVSGNLELSTTCPGCNEEMPIVLPIELIEFDATNLKPLQFTVNTVEGPYIIVCSHITVDDMKYIDATAPKIDDAAVVLRTMMKPDGNDIIELTYEEKLELFNQLDSSNVEKMVKYIAGQPKMKYHLDITCPECGHQFGGELDDFFI